MKSEIEVLQDEIKERYSRIESFKNLSSLEVKEIDAAREKIKKLQAKPEPESTLPKTHEGYEFELSSNDQLVIAVLGGGSSFTVRHANRFICKLCALALYQISKD